MMMIPGTQNVERRTASESGMALIAVLLLLMTMSGLAAALAINSNTETLIARNHQTAAQARAAAEAGLSHAVELAIDYLQDWETTTDPDTGMPFVSASAAMSNLLEGDGSLEDLGLDDVPQLLGSLVDVSYEVRVLDDDDPERGLSPTDITTILENNEEDLDANTKIIVRAVGRASGNAVATVEATIAPRELPAILTNDDLMFKGNITVTAPVGNPAVHTNADLDFEGGTVSITGDCTSSGDTDGSPTVGTCGEGEPNISVPDVRASDYLSKAGYTLHTGGMYSIGNGSPVPCANPCLGAWRWESNEWRVTAQGNLTPWTGTYYSETAVTISGSPGSALSPVQMTLIAKGSINISGSPYLQPDTSGLLLVTDQDLSIGGNMTATASEALIVVREQLDIGGNASIAGQILVQDAATVSTLVTANSLHGNITLTYTGSLDNKFLAVSAWRLVP
ncbi:MAG: hypothetical protein HY657_10510 [Acidobacteria bacterium]|nr:hypothetical protein [Acidobacteriota bacterium]